MLSAFEYGQRALQKGQPNAFSHLTTLQTSLDFITRYLRIWEKWMKQKNVLIARYEDLLTDYDNEVARLTKFLKIDGSSPKAREVIDAYRPGAAEGQQGLHFYKGKIGRFREFYNAEEQAILKSKMGPYLQRMGYEI
jgi:hypothetical protein